MDITIACDFDDLEIVLWTLLDDILHKNDPYINPILRNVYDILDSKFGREEHLDELEYEL